MTEIYPHEAWCPRCRVSHPPGTKRCLHCGHGVLPVRPVEGMRASATMSRGPIEIPMAPDIVSEDAEREQGEMSRVARPLRFGIAAIWVVLAAAGAILRACTERG